MRKEKSQRWGRRLSLLTITGARVGRWKRKDRKHSRVCGRVYNLCESRFRFLPSAYYIDVEDGSYIYRSYLLLIANQRKRGMEKSISWTKYQSLDRVKRYRLGIGGSVRVLRERLIVCPEQECGPIRMLFSLAAELKSYISLLIFALLSSASPSFSRRHQDSRRFDTSLRHVSSL